MSISERLKNDTLEKLHKTLNQLRPDSREKAEEFLGLLYELVTSISVENPSIYLETIRDHVSKDSNTTVIVELFFKPSFIGNEDYQEYLNILSAESESEIKRLDLVVEISRMGYPVMKINQLTADSLESLKNKLEGLLDAGIPISELISLEVETIDQLSQHIKLITQLKFYNVELSVIVSLSPELLTEFSDHLSDLNYLFNELEFTLPDIIRLDHQKRDIFYQIRNAVMTLVQDSHIPFEKILNEIMIMDTSKKDLLLRRELDVVVEMINQLKIPYAELFSLDIDKLVLILDKAYAFNQIIQSGITFSELIQSPLLETILTSDLVLMLAESQMKVSLFQLERLANDEDKSTILLKNFQDLDYLVLSKGHSANQILNCYPPLLKIILQNRDNVDDLITDGRSLEDLNKIGMERAVLMIKYSNESIHIMMNKNLSAKELLQCDPTLLRAIFKNAVNISKLVELGLSLQTLINQGTPKAMLIIKNADKVVDLLKERPNLNLIKQPINFLQAMLEKKASEQKQKDSDNRNENKSINDNHRRK